MVNESTPHTDIRGELFYGRCCVLLPVAPFSLYNCNPFACVHFTKPLLVDIVLFAHQVLDEVSDCLLC
jgi:hypothetical protein